MYDFNFSSVDNVHFWNYRVLPAPVWLLFTILGGLMAASSIGISACWHGKFEFYARFVCILLFLLLMLWLLREQESSWVGWKLWFHEQVGSVVFSSSYPFQRFSFSSFYLGYNVALPNLSYACSCRWGCSWLPMSSFWQFANTGSSFLLVFGNLS